MSLDIHSGFEYIYILKTYKGTDRMNALAELDPTNFAEMAALAGMTEPTPTTGGYSTLKRLGLQHKALTAKQEIKGKKVNVEVVEAGSYRIEGPTRDDPKVYATEVTFRPFMQRFLYKRFVKGVGGMPNEYIKTVMGTDIKADLKDNSGTFNCGKPSGYVEDWNSVPEQTQKIIKATKRTRVIFGLATFKNAINDQGDTVDIAEEVPVVWEVDNRDAFKTMGVPFNQMMKRSVMPMQYTMDLKSEAVDLPNGDQFYLPLQSLDLSDAKDLDADDQEIFKNFLDWIKQRNKWVTEDWEAKNVATLDDDQKALVNEFVDVTLDEEIPF
ncbi:MAG: hypothetical protein CMI60_22715 [Parvibaculum sp.]|nr:hypothetical protein [Parvibaculum sp.]